MTTTTPTIGATLTQYTPGVSRALVQVKIDGVFTGDVAVTIKGARIVPDPLDVAHAAKLPGAATCALDVIERRTAIEQRARAAVRAHRKAYPETA